MAEEYVGFGFIGTISKLSHIPQVNWLRQVRSDHDPSRILRRGEKATTLDQDLLVLGGDLALEGCRNKYIALELQRGRGLVEELRAGKPL